MTSGQSISEVITFVAGGATRQSLSSFTIMDDNVGLETVESYPLQFNRTFPSGDIMIGRDSEIRITDDDSE